MTMETEQDTLSAESIRQIVHIAAVLPAFLLRFLPGPWAFFLAFMLLVHNAFLLALYAPRLFRTEEKRFGGIVGYPCALCILVLLFPQRLEVVAGAWGMLAVGEGLAALAGRFRPLVALPWNPKKSLGGLIAFVVGGALISAILIVWTTPAAMHSPWILLVTLVSALIAGLAETLPFPVDDSFLTAIVAGISLWILGGLGAHWSSASLSTGSLVFALLLNAVVAAVFHRLRLTNANGAFGGAAIGILVYILGGPSAYILLLVFLIMVWGAAWYAFVCGEGEEVSFADRRGRGSRHALGNCALALCMALAWAVTDGMDSFLKLLYLAALSAALCERIGSELGMLFGRGPRLPLSGEPVEPKTKGAITAEGTLLGIAGVIVFAAIGAALGICDAASAPAAIAGAVIACWLGAVLSETAQKGGLSLDSEWMSFINTCIGAFLAAFLAVVLGGEFYSWIHSPTI